MLRELLFILTVIPDYYEGDKEKYEKLSEKLLKTR